MRRKIFIVIFSVFLFATLSQTALAVSWWPLVPCGLNEPTAQEIASGKAVLDPSYYQPCNRCDLLKLLKNIIDFALIGLMPPAAAMLFVWGGLLILMGGANPGLISQGKGIFWNTAMGIAIILISWLITNTIIRSLAEDNIAPEWWKLECSVTTSPTPTSTPIPTSTSTPTPTLIGTATPTPTGTSTPTPTGTTTPIPTSTVTPIPTVQPLSITTSSLSDARQGSIYSQTVQVTGGRTPYNWSISGSSQLPSGLMINSSTGEIFGTPTVAGNFNFTVMVGDSSSPQKSVTKLLSVKVVVPASSVVISSVASNNITTNSATITWTTDKISTSQVAYGPTTAYGPQTSLDNNLVTSHSVTVTGLSSNTTYNYQAISSVPGFTARSSNYTFKTTGTIIQPLTISTTTLSDATQGTAYSQTLSATGGSTPYTWSTSSGSSLPAGLTMNPSTGAISGTPTTVGTFTFTVKVEDSSSPKKNATKQLSVKVMTGTVVTNCGDPGLVCSNTARSCPSLVRDTGVPQGQTSWAYLIPLTANSIPGVNTNKLLEAIMRIETNGQINKQSGSSPPSCGLMQIQAGTANMYRNRCGISHDITCDWLRGGPQSGLQQGETLETVARASICIASEYMIAAKNSSCYGGQIRDLAAGYNGGSGCDQDNPRGNALALSVSCSQQSTANPKNDLDCSNRPTLRYECLWSNASHTTCNTGFNETRDYAAKFNACYF